MRQAEPAGRNGECRMRHPRSATLRSALRWLHRRHADTTFSQTCSPPRLRGTTWSRLVAGASQYTHRPPSRAKTARRVSGIWRMAGHPHKADEPHDGRQSFRQVLAVNDLLRRLDGGRLLRQYQYQRATIRNHAQWFVRRVQDQGMGHSPPSVTCDTPSGQHKCAASRSRGPKPGG